MAGGLMGGEGGGWGSRSRRGGGFSQPMSDINVTPFVDVMLVLLVVFMVAAPMMTVNVPLDLPSTGGGEASTANPITVSVQGDGKLFVQEQEVTEATLVETVNAASKGQLDQRIFVRGDKTVDYGRMVGVLGTLSGQGYRKIGLVSSVKSK